VTDTVTVTMAHVHSITSPNQNASFHLFPYLADELKITILSFVADAPFEVLPENYKKSSLTTHLPHVSRKFRDLSQSDLYWKKALERQVKNEANLWKPALQNMSNSASFVSVQDLVQRTQKRVNKPYKKIYQDVVSNHLRFKGPIFVKPGQVQLGEAYTLHLQEPRYRRLIAHVMKDQPEEAIMGGRIHSPVSFLHANRNSLAPKTPAVLVQVVRCHIHADGRADVTVLPQHFVWIEKVWIGRNQGRLFFAQSLRMTAVATSQMHQLVRSEMMTNVIGLMAGEFDGPQDSEYLENTNPNQRPAAAVPDHVIQAALEEDFDTSDDESREDEDDSDASFDDSEDDDNDEDSRFYEPDSDTSLDDY